MVSIVSVVGTGVKSGKPILNFLKVTLYFREKPCPASSTVILSKICGKAAGAVLDELQKALTQKQNFKNRFCSMVHKHCKNN
jgi:hypothetical protein